VIIERHFYDIIRWSGAKGLLEIGVALSKPVLMEAMQQEKQKKNAETTGHGAFFQENEKAHKVRKN
jgi:hypothetical protein